MSVVRVLTRAFKQREGKTMLTVVRRTFEAKRHPIGSEERVRLNLSWVTSEYLPSVRYGILEDGKETCWNYRTKRECEAKIEEIKLRRKSES